MSAASADSAPPHGATEAPGASGRCGPTDAPDGWVVRSARPATEAVRVFGLSPEERMLRALHRAGCRTPRVVDVAEAPRTERAVLALRGDVVLDERLVAALRDAPGTLLEEAAFGAPGAQRDRATLGVHLAGANAGDHALALLREDIPPREALRRMTPEQLVPAYVAKLRKREPPWAFAARADLVPEIERHLFAASYKGLTDLVTRWVWPRPAAAATRWCAERGMHPNTITLWSWVLAIAAFWLFARGVFGPGLLCAWAMTFLDTVDGKLARVTLTSSRTGDVLDHGLDLVHPPFWWWAFGAGLGPGHATTTAIVVVGYLVGRALEGAFLARFGFETHSWRPIDGLFRTITARRNPNLILLTVGWLGGRADLGLVMVALWTLVSLAFHGVRLAQAEGRRTRGVGIAPWEGA